MKNNQKTGRWDLHKDNSSKKRLKFANTVVKNYKRKISRNVRSKLKTSMSLDKFELSMFEEINHRSFNM